MENSAFTFNDIDTRPVVYTAEQGRDARLYQRLKAEAAERGVELIEVSDAEYRELLGQPADVEPDPAGALVERDGARFWRVSSSHITGHGSYTEAKQAASEHECELWVAD